MPIYLCDKCGLKVNGKYMLYKNALKRYEICLSQVQNVCQPYGNIKIAYQMMSAWSHGPELHVKNAKKRVSMVITRSLFP